MTKMKPVVKDQILKVICGSPDRPLKIGDIEIQCYVLEDETRVLSQRELQQAIGLSKSGPASAGEHRLSNLIARISDKIPESNVLLMSSIQSPIKFMTPWGRIANGYEATILADICEAVLAARKQGFLHPSQEKIADQCEILMRGFARVGIIALVDEATGYQYIRARNAIENLLKRYIAEDLQKWVKTFDDDFYIELFRLRKWDFYSINKRPGIAGRITVDIVYRRLAPKVLEKLQEKTERDSKGRPKTKLFQHLTPTEGHPKLREHLAAVTALMKAAPDWRRFYSSINRALPKYDTTIPMLMEFPGDDSEFSGN